MGVCEAEACARSVSGPATAQAASYVWMSSTHACPQPSPGSRGGFPKCAHWAHLSRASADARMSFSIRVFDMTRPQHGFNLIVVTRLYPAHALPLRPWRGLGAGESEPSKTLSVLKRRLLPRVGEPYRAQRLRSG